MRCGPRLVLPMVERATRTSRGNVRLCSIGRRAGEALEYVFRGVPSRPTQSAENSSGSVLRPARKNFASRSAETHERRWLLKPRVGIS